MTNKDDTPKLHHIYVGCSECGLRLELDVPWHIEGAELHSMPGHTIHTIFVKDKREGEYVPS